MREETREQSKWYLGHKVAFGLLPVASPCLRYLFFGGVIEHLYALSSVIGRKFTF